MSLGRVASSVGLNSSHSLPALSNSVIQGQTSVVNALEALGAEVQAKANTASLSAVATAGTFASLTSKPTTLLGFGITDGQLALGYTPYNSTNPSGYQTAAQVAGLISAAAYALPVATGSVLGGVKQGSNVTIDGSGVISVAAPVTSLAWGSITGTPTTLAGFGISDAAPLSHASDYSLHLTSGQNTWLDAVTATAVEVNYLSGVSSNVQVQVSGKLSKSGASMDSGANLVFSGGGTVTGVAMPTSALDVVNKTYVDNLVASGTKWVDPVRNPDLVGISDHLPTSPISSGLYIAYTDGAGTGYPQTWTWAASPANGNVGGSISVSEYDLMHYTRGTWQKSGTLASGTRLISGVFTNAVETTSGQDLAGTGIVLNEIVQYVGATGSNPKTASNWDFPHGRVGGITFSVVSITTASKMFAITGDVTTSFHAGNTFTYNKASSANNGTHNIVSVVFNSPNTEVVVSQSVTTDTGGTAAPEIADGTATLTNNSADSHFGQTYLYTAGVDDWVQISGPGSVDAGTGLGYSGTTLNVNLGAGIQELPTDEVGIDVYPVGGLMTTVDGTNSSTLTNAQLSLTKTGASAGTFRSVTVDVYGRISGGTNPTTLAGYGIVDAASAAPVQSVAGRTGAVTLTSTDVGLANVNNTSDANKPVSTAQATADSAVQTAAATDATTKANAAQAAAIAASAPVAHVGSGGGAHANVVAAGASGFMTGADKTKLDAVSGSNTGDETLATIKAKLGVTVLSGSNTGDQTIAGLSGNPTAASLATALSGQTMNIAGSASTAGTVTTGAQPNITSVGTLSSLSVSGNTGVGPTAPAQRLHISESGATPVFTRVTNSGNTGGIDFGLDGTGHSYVWNNNSVAGISHLYVGNSNINNTGSVIFYTKGAQQGLIASDGTTTLGGVSSAPAFKVTPVASQANWVGAVPATAGNTPYIRAEGADTDINLALLSKGAGSILLATSYSGTSQVYVTHTSGANQYLTLTGDVSNGPRISCGGAANANLYLSAGAGTGSLYLYTNNVGSCGLRVDHVAGANRNIVVTPSNGDAPTISSSAGPLQVSPGGAVGALNYLWMQLNLNGSTPARASNTGLIIGSNVSAGNADVDFFNPYYTAAVSFDFRQITASGVSASVLRLLPVASGARNVEITQATASGNPTIGTSGGALAISSSIVQTASGGGDFSILSSTAASSESSLRVETTQATSGISYKLSNSGLNKQATIRLNASGQIEIYGNQTAGAASTSGSIQAVFDNVTGANRCYFSAGTNPQISTNAGSLVLAPAGGAVSISGNIFATGYSQFMSATATPAGGAAATGLFMGSAAMGIYFGSGAPTVSAAQGSIYIRSDGAAATGLYTNTNGSTGWSAVGGGGGGGAALSAVAGSTTYYLGLSASSSGTWTDARVDTSNLYYTSADQTLYATNYNTASDARLKDNIQTIANPVQTVKQLRGVGFDWKFNGKKSYGVIAQELEQVLPELVNETEGHKSVNYTALIGFLLEAVKELSAKVEALEAK